MRTRTTVRAALTAGLLAVTAAGVAAQSSNGSATRRAGEPPAAIATRTAEPPTVDGRLDDPAWLDAAAIGEFVQREPREGQPASERTEVRVLFDDEAMYVGAWLYDGAPHEIVLGETRRDASLQDSDAFVVVLDTYLDRQNAFVFGTSPAAIEYDGQVTQEGAAGQQGRARAMSGTGAGFNLNWDGSWTVATSLDDDGWYAEFRIPFSTLRYGADRQQVWGANFSRRIRRRNEDAVWSPVPRQFSVYRVPNAGTLEGIEVPVRRSAYLTPYVLAAAQRDYVSAAEFDYPLELGGDLKLSLTPSLALDLTYNTDFAQVEVDEQQVNLTRFSLFFPEKRPFFLENAGTFAVGSSEAVELFFSRRIGITEGGLPVPIIGGGRVTGKVGGLTIGLLDIVTDERAGVQPRNNYGVARVLRELPNRSRVGGLMITRDALDGGDDHNRTYALDGRIGLGQGGQIDAYVARTQTPGLEGREHAFGVNARYETRVWRNSIGYTEVGEAFNPEVGFLERSGYRFLEGLLFRYVRTPAVPWLRELRPHVSYRSYRDFDGVEQSRTIHLDSHVAFENGAFFSPALNLTREGLTEPFEISPGVVVPPGVYDNVEAAWRYNTDESAPLSVNGGLDWGGFLSGSRRGGQATIGARRGAALAAALRLAYNQVELAEGSFETKLVGLRVAYAFTPRLFLQSLVQYNSQTERWSGNLRLGWLDTAGTGLFLVYNETQDVTGLDGPLDRAFLLKFTRRFDLLP